MDTDRLITIAIHTFEKAQIIKGVLESEGIPTVIQNVNLIQPVISSGVRVRIHERDLPHALQVLEQYPLLKEDKSYEEPVERLNRILIPVDYSSYSYHACQIGFNLAKTLGAEVMLLHVYFSPYFPGAIPITDTFTYEISEDEAFKRVFERANQETSSFTEKLNTQIAEGKLADVKFDITLREGIPEEEIIQYTKEYNPQIVIMGTRGKDQKEQDLIGSVTAEVLDSVRCPVFAVPENTPLVSMEQIKNIAFFIAFEQKELIVLDTFMRLMKPFTFAVSLIHIANKQDEWDEIKMAGIKDYFVKNYPDKEVSCEIIQNDDFLSNIEAVVRNKEIDVLVLASRKRNIFARLFNPSIAHKMLFHTDTPILSIPS